MLSFKLCIIIDYYRKEGISCLIGKKEFDINTENWVNQNLLTQMFYVPLRSREESTMHLILRGIDVNYVDGENEKGADLQKGKDFSMSCSDKKYNKIRHFLLSLDGLTEEQRSNLQKI